MASPRSQPPPVLQVSVQNKKLNLHQLQQIYLPLFSKESEKIAVEDLLRAVYKHCEISPYDSTIRYPNNTSSSSSVGQLLKFFVCGKRLRDMPPDAPEFLDFLKSIKFPTNRLCVVKMK